jgi:hypothetical protein
MPVVMNPGFSLPAWRMQGKIGQRESHSAELGFLRFPAIKIALLQSFILNLQIK